MTERNSRKYILIVGVLLVAGVFLSFFLGKFSLGPKEVMGILTSPITGSETFWTSQQEQVFWAIRLPRILLACLVGCALASAGCVYQAVFENPMAAPDFLGASSGAAFGAALAIILGGERCEDYRNGFCLQHGNHPAGVYGGKPSSGKQNGRFGAGRTDD